MFRFFAAISVLVVAACSSNSANTVTSSTSSTPAQLNADLTKEQIATCWAQAGLKGDIYKLLTPAEVQGLSKIGDASKEQISQFKTCIAA